MDGDALTDIHGHGGGGHAFGDTVDGTLAAVAAHREAGTHAMVASLVSLPLAEAERQIRVVREAMERDSALVGIHLEGPFLAPSRKGAHDPGSLALPTPQLVGRLLDACGDALRQITMAPELPGALAAIETFVDAGVTVAVGHTDADAAVAREAFDRGATLITHAFNAMHGITGREIGPVGAALDDPRVWIEVIADGIHVDPALIATLFRAAPGRIVLVTDAMAAAASSDGHYLLGSREVEVTGGRAVLAGTGTLAGSTLTLRRAVEVCVEAGVPRDEAVAAASAVPRAVLGLA
ncbi:N-acetylglucosamine-6-phosphate deacetylase [Demequina muriae]|uniref:Amidohydrolase family protein n=1 Tax=Demequina muriae TaxID=3051664 RepID=A0ABT8GJ19_9MICO|nr:amidohydrolase family protein [Demequina sp. EGI L300058]MDN4480946.1 amidohydrolase family protein [Demequina sp. EGI L300058]